MFALPHPTPTQNRPKLQGTELSAEKFVFLAKINSPGESRLPINLKVWWSTPLIPALERKRQAGLVYAVRPSLSKQHTWWLQEFKLEGGVCSSRALVNTVHL